MVTPSPQPAQEKPNVFWRVHVTRAIILEDLECDGCLAGNDHLAADFVWEWYKNLPEFSNVGFEQFARQLSAHRKQSSIARDMAKRDAKAVARDLALYPRRFADEKAEPVFDLDDGAKNLLRADVKYGRHKGLLPSFFQTKRDDYMIYDSDIFRKRVYQEVRRKKFIHFLSLKRIQERPAPPRNFDFDRPPQKRSAPT